MICLAPAGLAGGEFRLGESLASPLGQVPTCQSGSPWAPNVGISDLMAAAG